MGQRKTRGSKTRVSASTDSAQELDSFLGQLSIGAPIGSFRSIANRANVLLMTPYIHYPFTSIGSAESTDPFEPLGRALVSHHPQIRHVPYVAKRGMVETHGKLMKEAGAVVLVVCTTSSVMPPSGEKLDGAEDQQSFARRVGRVLRKLGISTVLVTLGIDDEKCGRDSFGAVITCTEWNQLQEVPGVIFED
jgi:hypothetical protein